jgi:hypothetical protein
VTGFRAAGRAFANHSEMRKPTPPPPVDENESTTGLIEALCEISADTAEAPLSVPHIEAIERRLKTEEPSK